MTTLVEVLTGVAESIMFYMIYGAFFELKENVPKRICSLCYLLFAILSYMSFRIFGGTLINIILLYSGSFVLSFLYKTNIKSRIATPLFVFTINILIEMTVWYLTSLIFNINSLDTSYDPGIWMAGAILSKTILLFIMNFVRLRFRNRTLFENRNYWLLFVVVFLPTSLINYLLFKLTLTITESYVSVLAIIASIGLIVSSFTVLFLYERFSIQSESVNREEQYKQQLRSQSKHLDEILLMQNQLKSFRHDIKNHWVALRGFFQKNDYEGGIKYIDEISEKLLAGETIDTGNVALDAIISTKKALAKEKNIEFESTIQIPEKMPLEATDICIIFGNSIDNAIEACEKIKSGKRHIRLSVIFEEDTILCKISNTINKNKKISLVTTKADKENHGFGFENIKQALSEYNHVLKTEQTDGEFILSFIIFNG